MKQLNIQQVYEMLSQIASALIQNEEQLGEIDQKIGDGDHGIGMRNGAKAILVTLHEEQQATVGDIFKKAGMAMMGSMGGASGVIFGSLFLGLAKTTKDKKTISVEDLHDGMAQAIKDIQKRGKAELGDKTMLDALIPATETLNYYKTADFMIALEKASESATVGVEKTKKYPAKFGRSKFLGDRTVGYQDAGATSVNIIFTAMYDYLKSVENTDIEKNMEGRQMKIGFGADNNAVEFKDDLKKYAEELGYEVVDFGIPVDSSVDYPAVAFDVSHAIKNKEIDRGVLCCGTGIGMAIAANKVAGIRAAQITDIYSAERAQLSNNAQIATFGAFVQGIDSAKLLLAEYLSHTFEPGTQSEPKINQISQYEAKK